MVESLKRLAACNESFCLNNPSAQRPRIAIIHVLDRTERMVSSTLRLLALGIQLVHTSPVLPSHEQSKKPIVRKTGKEVFDP